MKKNIFVLVMSVCLLTLVRLSGSAQTLIKTYAESSMAQPSLIVGLDSTAYLSVNYADKDSCEVFRINNGNFISIFKHVGKTNVADFHVFSKDTLYGPVGEKLYAIALDGSGYSVLSNHYDQPLLLSGENLFISTGEAVEEHYLQHLIMRDVKSGSVDTVYSYFSQVLPITQHIGVVGSDLYFSLAHANTSTIIKYGIISGVVDTLTNQGTVSFGVSFGGKFAYSLLNSDTTKVDIVLVSLDTTVIITLDRKEYFDFLMLSEGPNGEFIVNSQEIIFIWDGMSEIESWSHEYEFTSTNWRNRHISSSYDEGLVKTTYNIFVGETQYQLFRLDSLDAQFIVGKDNILYIRRPVNNWLQTQIIMYDLCPDVRMISSVADQTYFSGKEIRIEGVLNLTLPTLFEASIINFLPVSGIDSSQGGSYEFKFGSGCPTN